VSPNQDLPILFAGNSNSPFAQAVADQMGVQLGDAFVGRFSEGEIRVKINQNVRGQDVFILQPTCPPVNDNLMELLILLDALRRASARRITAVLPYYGYARQDRKDQPRVPITAKLVANLIAGAGASRVLTMDLHAGQIQGFFDIPLDHLFAVNTFVDYFKAKIDNMDDWVVVAPDVGAIKMARAYSKRFQSALAVVDKRRISDVDTEVMDIMGDVRGKHALIVDDLVSTAGSLVQAVKGLRDAGAKDVYAVITHPLLVGPAIERLEGSELKELVVTDSIPIPKEKQISRIKVLSVAPLFAQAIQRIHEGDSISVLFREYFDEGGMAPPVNRAEAKDKTSSEKPKDRV